MRAGSARTVLKLYDWLPPEGEVRVSIRYSGLDLFVDVLFEKEGDRTQQLNTLVFERVHAFYVSAFPGVNLLGIEYQKGTSLGDLVEFEESEAAKAWSEHLQYSTMRHFQVYFLSANLRLEVFGEIFRLQGTGSS